MRRYLADKDKTVVQEYVSEPSYYGTKPDLKKHTPHSGSGKGFMAMIKKKKALIAGAVVGVCAIGGIIIVLMKKKGKKEDPKKEYAQMT